MRHRSLRTAASITSTLALVAAGIAATTSAATADPDPDVDTTLCVDQPVRTGGLVPGEEVTGLTTTQGITPTAFTGVFTSVLKDGAFRGKDILLFRLEGPRITKTLASGDVVVDAGVWAGMSGSPVYDADDNLVGAVAYGFSNGSSTLAGVTPAADILDLQNAPTATADSVALPRAVSKQIASSTATKTDDAGDYAQMPQLKLPRVSIGTPGAVATKLAGKSRLLARTHSRANPKFATGSAAVDIDATDAIVPGGNIAAAWSHGDVTLAAVGTVTAVCGDRVYAFGHPDDYVGNKTTETFHAAEAAEIQEDSAGTSYKLANIDLDPVGQITQDRLSGILGVIGQTPHETTVTTNTTVGNESTSAVTKVATPDAVGTVVYSQLFNDAIDGLDAYADGGDAVMSWTINYTPKGGTPASFSRSQRYSSSYYFAEDLGYDVASDVEFLQTGSDQKIVINSVTVDSTLTPDYNALRVTGIDVRSKGKWVPVKRGGKATAKIGKTFPVQVHLKPASASSVATPVVKRLDQTVVGSARGTGVLNISGTSGYYYEDDDYLTIDYDEDEDYEDYEDGEDYYYGSSPLTLPQVLAALSSQPRYDSIRSLHQFVTKTGVKLRTRSTTTPAVTTGSWGIRLSYKK